MDLRDRDTKQNPIIVDELRSKTQTQQRRPTQTSHTKAQTSGSQDGRSRKQCRCCGGASHKREDCPAIEAQCHRCGKKGHYRSQCLTKLSSTQSAPVLSTKAELQTLNPQETYLDTLNADLRKSWSTTIQLGMTTLPFKLDTGAEVSTVSEKAFNSFSMPPQLQRSTKILYGSEHVPLTALGKFTTELTYKEKVCTQKLFVIKGLTRNLLGLPAIVTLGLVARVDELKHIIISLYHPS